MSIEVDFEISTNAPRVPCHIWRFSDTCQVLYYIEGESVEIGTKGFAKYCFIQMYSENPKSNSFVKMTFSNIHQSQAEGRNRYFRISPNNYLKVANQVLALTVDLHTYPDIFNALFEFRNISRTLKWKTMVYGDQFPLRNTNEIAAYQAFKESPESSAIIRGLKIQIDVDGCIWRPTDSSKIATIVGWISKNSKEEYRQEWSELVCLIYQLLTYDRNLETFEHTHFGLGLSHDEFVDLVDESFIEFDALKFFEFLELTIVAHLPDPSDFIKIVLEKPSWRTYYVKTNPSLYENSDRQNNLWIFWVKIVFARSFEDSKEKIYHIWDYLFLRKQGVFDRFIQLCKEFVQYPVTKKSAVKIDLDSIHKVIAKLKDKNIEDWQYQYHIFY